MTTEHDTKGALSELERAYHDAGASLSDTELLDASAEYIRALESERDEWRQLEELFIAYVGPKDVRQAVEELLASEATLQADLKAAREESDVPKTDTTHFRFGSDDVTACGLIHRTPPLITTNSLLGVDCLGCRTVLDAAVSELPSLRSRLAAVEKDVSTWKKSAKSWQDRHHARSRVITDLQTDVRAAEERVKGLEAFINDPRTKVLKLTHQWDRESGQWIDPDQTQEEG